MASQDTPGFQAKECFLWTGVGLPLGKPAQKAGAPEPCGGPA